MVDLAATPPDSFFSERVSRLYPSKSRDSREGKGVEIETQVVVPLTWVPSVSPSPSGRLEVMRSPTAFKSVAAMAVGATALWTPAAGKSFRVLGFVIVPSGGLAAAGPQVISLQDGGASFGIDIQTYLPIAASVVAQSPICVSLPGNGYLSAAPGNVLSVNLSAAVTAGAVSVSVWGTEE